jgi:hypothetical protein
MEDVGDRIADKVQALSDIELAFLLCLITEQHCIIEADQDGVDDLDHEIRLVSRSRYSNTSHVDSDRLLQKSSVSRGQYLSAMRTQRWTILDPVSS